MEFLRQQVQADVLRQVGLEIPGQAGDGALVLLLRGRGGAALEQGDLQPTLKKLLAMSALCLASLA